MKLSTEKLIEIINNLPDPDKHEPGFTLAFPVSANGVHFHRIDFICAERFPKDPINKSKSIWTIEVQ